MAKSERTTVIRLRVKSKEKLDSLAAIFEKTRIEILEVIIDKSYDEATRYLTKKVK